MLEQKIEVRTFRLTIGPSRGERRPDDRVERLILEPGCDHRAMGRNCVPVSRGGIIRLQSTHPFRPHGGRNLLANAEFDDSLLEASGGKRNPERLDRASRGVYDECDSAIQRDPGKLDWKPRPILTKSACLRQRSRIPDERAPGQATDSGVHQSVGLSGRRAIGFRRRFIPVAR